ncbi:phosphonate C-P lyase system protein PhnH [Streptomyces sp. NPDC090499]|uniref:phosphonate C-P lyase system protein PhnH n=1 Tax=Streptomyces sp. NPDC090499 TaxID=3365965 RepID=UPI003811E853
MTVAEQLPPVAGTADLVTAAKPSPRQAQAVFRAVLDALARPGTTTRLPADPAGRVPAALLPLLALADLGTGFRVLEAADGAGGADGADGADGAGGPGRWSEVVAVATNAPAVPLAEARLVAAVRPVTPAEIRQLRRGSAEAPEDGALLCVPVAALDGGPRKWRLSGPGVPGGLVVAPDGLPDGFAEARAEAVAGFPAGIDLLLAAPDGRLLGLPRSTAVVEEEN